MRDGFAYVRQRYGVPAKRGMRVVMNGKPGRITSSAGHYIRVRFDGEKFSSYCHPTWEMTYLGGDASGSLDTPCPGDTKKETSGLSAPMNERNPE